jgi:two-component system, OmpR family, sensor histidine kinase KdpD
MLPTDVSEMNGRWRTGSTWLQLAGALLAIAAVTLVMHVWLHVSNAATVSITYLLFVLLIAATSRLRVAVVTSIVAMLCLNFFFLPPVRTFTIADPQNWVALFAFLIVSLVASNLSAVAHARTEEAVGRRDELARLFDLSRDVLLIPDGSEALPALARTIARRFDLDFVAIAVPSGDEWKLFDAGATSIALDDRDIAAAFADAQRSIEFDAYARTYAGHRTAAVNGRMIRLVPLRLGTKPIGVLAASGRPVEAGTLDTLAGVVAIAIERAHLLDERKAGELARQGEQLKTALLASLGHDLRTPLTAIRVAASNVKVSELTPADRLGQIDLILAEVERLTRLFENLLDMARIDAGAIATDARWTHPSEIVAVACGQVEQTLRGHAVEIAIEPDLPVRLDPRLTATALAHLLENAAQYAPSGSPIEVEVHVADDQLTIGVRDHGPGIASADLPHLFERFYRGCGANVRASGTGMGLWIARGLLAAEHGRVWAENHRDGGTRFTIAVAVAVKEIEAAPSPT